VVYRSVRLAHKHNRLRSAFTHFTCIIGIGILTFNIFGISILFGVSSGLNTLLAQAEGRGEETVVMRQMYVNRMVIIMVACSIPLGLLNWFSGPLLNAAGQPVRRVSMVRHKRRKQCIRPATIAMYMVTVTRCSSFFSWSCFCHFGAGGSRCLRDQFRPRAVRGQPLAMHDILFAATSIEHPPPFAGATHCNHHRNGCPNHVFSVFPARVFGAAIERH